MNSAATRSRINAGTLRVEGALYDIGTGKIVWLGTHPDQAAILAAAGPATGSHGGEKTPQESATPAQTEIEKQVTTEKTARAEDHAVVADTEQAGQTEPKQTETTIQETTTGQEALDTVERQAQVEAQATPEHVDEAGDNGLWFIFFLLVLILIGVAMKSRKNQ
jgi:thiol:disulfide interchange protein